MSRSDKIQALIQGIGLLAVVVSLIFVGLQLRQSQAIAIAAQYQARMDAASSHYAAILQSEPGLRVIGRDLKADILADSVTPPEIKAWVESQPDEELAFRAVGAIIFLKSHDNVFFQYQEGFLSTEAWEALRAQLKAGLDDPNTWVRGVYEEHPEVWRESYRELIEGLIAE